MISFDRDNAIKVEDAMKYIDSLPWEDEEFDDRSNIDILKQILTKEKYEEFDEDFKDIRDWLWIPRHDKMKKARKEFLDEMMEGEPPITEEELDKVRREITTLFVIKFDNGLYNYKYGCECVLSEATRYNTKEEAEEVVKDLDLMGVQCIEAVGI